MTKILGISGSLRAGSFNTRLLASAAKAIPDGSSLEIGSIRGIPLYDGDLESASGLPESVQKLKAQVVACDGLLLVTPEYNNGIPGVFKNAIDWLSRPSSDIPKVTTRHLAPTAIFQSDFDRQLYRITLVGQPLVGVDGRPSTAIEGVPILSAAEELRMMTAAE